MTLDDDEKERRRAHLAEALVPQRYNSVSLAKHGAAGQKLRRYMKDDYSSDAQSGNGGIFVSDKIGLAASFARDIVISGASAQFYYLQTFATRLPSMESMPQQFVIEWFEQSGAPMPFTPKERYHLESTMAGLMDQGTLFYLFTAVHPRISGWWTKSFSSMIMEYCRLIEVNEHGNERNDEGTPFVGGKEQRQKTPKSPSRVRVC